MRRFASHGVLLGVVSAGLFTMTEPARADVTAVTGSAFGYFLNVSVLGTAYPPTGPTPTVTLPPAGGNETASANSGSATAGPSTFFTSGPIEVKTQGSLGPSGSVASSTSIETINTSGQEVFTASSLTSSCAAGALGITASTSITDGTLLVDTGDSDPNNAILDHPSSSINLPTAPAPNTTYEGHVHTGNSTDFFRYVFNEQTVNPDGSITVNAAHQTFQGPNVIGDLIIGQSKCGITGTAVASSPTLTTQATPTATLGDPISDIATLSGGNNPTGTITFSVYGPDDATCVGPPVVTATTVSGNGDYSSDPVVPTSAGQYNWVAVYSGDVNNNPVTSPCGSPNETSTVDPAAAPADCSVTQLVFESVWVHKQQQQVKVVGANTGGEPALCRVTLFARRVSPTNGPTAPDYPGAYRLRVPSGGTFRAYFEVTPPVPGKYRVRVCARAIDSTGTIVDPNASNDCRTAFRTSS